ncbi:MAG TPA: ATP-binding protein, partial [Anaerolineaceae bacterium]
SKGEAAASTTPGPRSALIMPLFTSADPQPVGAFSVYTAPGDQRDFAQADWDQKVLGILCHYAALAVQNTARMDALRLAEDHRAATETFAAMGEIAANLLHRLNNKVGTIPVRVEGIQDKSAAQLQADPYLADNLAEIQRSAAEAMRVVHESLDQLRPIQLKPVSILTSVQEALRVAQDQRALTEAFAAIGDIAANLLHRLNNKVGTIPVRVEGIQDKSAARLQADPYLADNLAEIQRSAAEAMRVVHESLDQLRPIQLKPVSILTSVQEALAVVRLPASVQVECSGLEALPAVQAGANRLVMVFTNLLDNASAAMESQGTIRIAGALRGPWVEVTVSDTGPGIPAELHEKIFEFSYSSRASTHPGNLGFGLWWVKSLMARFGGKVTVESGGTGGTTFTLSFPHAAEER